MERLTRDKILEAQDLPHEDVEVPEWGGTVTVQTLTGTQRDAFEQSLLEGKGKNRKVNLENIRAKLIVWAVVNEEGERLFTNADVRDLGLKSAAALDRVFTVAQRLSGISEEDVEELAADLSETPGDERSSSSASISE